MGFKRTSEGRVFFQGTEDNAGAKKADFRTLPPTTPPSGQPPATQFQILTLLKALNDKLKDSQTERNKMRLELDAYRKHIEDLEQKVGKGGGTDKNATAKAERAEKLAEDTFKELQETRKLILEIEDKTEKADKATLTLQRQMGQTRALGEELVKKQNTYEELVKRLDVAETRHEDLSEKVEKTTAEQSRILRQIEKVAEDRTRFMRKIERIEETVIQTRDALSAKAMVLLTEQGATAKTDGKIGAAPSVVAQVVAGKSARAQTDGLAAPWRSSHLFQAGVAASVLVLGILGGWAVSKIQQNPFNTQEFQVGQTSDTSATEEETPEETSQPSEQSSEPFETGEDPAAATQDYGTSENIDAFAEHSGPYTPETAPELSASNDIGPLDTTNEQKLIEMLDNDPDALAAELNKIEPSTPPPAPETSAPVNAAEKPAEKPVETASLKQPEKATEPPKAEEPPPAQKEPQKTDVAARMKPDNALPAQAREIERQAFAGVPEAQHDLAAIYTAGQGGVKQDYKRAAFWFREAADQGIANARYNLGVLYHQGLGVKPDIKEAIKWYKSAAALGHPEAQYNLGIAYIEGIGVGYDPKKAADNFEKAAQQGIIEAAYNLGLIYENGLLGEAQPDQALRWYKTAADNGSPEAKEALEQLAKTLDIKVEDVNRVAEGVKPVKQSSLEATPAATPAPPVSHESRQAMLAQIQDYLMRSGLYPGPADGVGSAQTEDAIRSYQSANNLTVDGKASEDLLAHMLGNESAANN